MTDHKENYVNQDTIERHIRRWMVWCVEMNKKGNKMHEAKEQPFYSNGAVPAVRINLHQRASCMIACRVTEHSTQIHGHTVPLKSMATLSPSNLWLHCSPQIYGHIVPLKCISVFPLKSVFTLVLSNLSSHRFPQVLVHIVPLKYMSIQPLKSVFTVLPSNLCLTGGNYKMVHQL